MRQTKNWWELETDDLDPWSELLESDDEEDCNKKVTNNTINYNIKSPVSKNDENYSTYPIDLFFLIAKYIRPEDIGRFALVSKGAYFVTHSAGFWKLLYKR